MADLSTKKDPLHLRDERPDYVEDKVGLGNQPDSDDDLSETNAPTINAGPQDPGALGVDKPTAPPLDQDLVDKAEKEGKGYQ